MNKTLKMMQISMLMAVTLIMGLTPIGMIPTPFLSISIVTVPVAIGAIILGPRAGLILGAAFGVTSFINALTGKSVMMAALFSVNPLAAAFTMLIPRCLEGFLTGMIFLIIKRWKPQSFYIAAVSCPILNTLFFMGSLMYFFYSSDYIQNLVSLKGAVSPLHLTVLLVGIQGVIEAVTCLVIAGGISQIISALFGSKEKE